MPSFVTPANGDDALAEHVAQLTENFSGLRNIPMQLTGINDAANYAQTIKNVGTGSKDCIMYAADGTTVLFQVDANGVRASASGGAAAPILTTAAGSITTDMLAPNAATQSLLAIVTSDWSTTSTTPIDVPGVTITLTTSGGGVQLWYTGLLAANPGSSFLTFAQDGVALGAALAYSASVGSAMVSMVYSYLPAAGTHTYTVRGSASSGSTLTIAALSGANSAFLAFELKR